MSAKHFPAFSPRLSPLPQSWNSLCFPNLREIYRANTSWGAWKALDVVRAIRHSNRAHHYARRSRAPTGTARYQMPQGHDSCARIRGEIERARARARAGNENGDTFIVRFGLAASKVRVTNEQWNNRWKNTHVATGTEKRRRVLDEDKLLLNRRGREFRCCSRNIIMLFYLLEYMFSFSRALWRKKSDVILGSKAASSSQLSKQEVAAIGARRHLRYKGTVKIVIHP